MNRLRNRQPRPPRGNNDGRGGRGRGGSRGGRGGGRPNQDRDSRWQPGTQQQAMGTVPTVQQVIPGASVFIILKEDQPTGEETHGVVQELLTRGNHPRGIKVRLRGGLVGRVQRMATGGEASSSEIQSTTQAMPAARANPLEGGSGSKIKYRDIRLDDDEEPPQRSLADYLPPGFEEPATTGNVSKQGSVAKCPFCEDFEGDEVAVSYHIDQKHLS